MAGWSYPGRATRKKPGHAAPRWGPRTSIHLEWTALVLFALDCFLQVMASFPVVGALFWLLNYVDDVLVLGLLYLLIVTRR